MWHELYDAGRIDYHPVFPVDDVRDVVALLRLNYERAFKQRG